MADRQLAELMAGPWRDTVAAARAIERPAITAALVACPHLAKRKRADLDTRALISHETLQYAGEQLMTMLGGDVPGQLDRRNASFFTSIADHAMECVVLGRLGRTDLAIAPLLALASRAWLVAERIADKPPFGKRHHAIAAAVLTGVDVDRYRALFPAIRSRFAPTVCVVLEALLGLADADQLEDAVGRTPDPDDVVYAVGHRSSLMALDALVRGKLTAAANAAARIGTGYVSLAAHKATSSVDVDIEQFADLLGSAAAALVSRAGGQVAAQPYVLAV
jgi:hypothetical protein